MIKLRDKRSEAFGFLYYLSIGLVVIGFLIQSNEFLAGGTFLFSLVYALRDYLTRRPDSITPMTVAAIFLGAYIGVSHFISGFVIDTRYGEAFYSYAAMDHLWEAQVMATLMALMPLVIFRYLDNSRIRGKSLLPKLPTVGFEVSSKVALRFCLLFLAFDWAGKIGGIEASEIGGGTIGFFLGRASEICIFMLAWDWLGPSPTFPKWTWWLLIGEVIIDVVYSALFSYMRGEVAYPLFAFFLAYLMRKALTRRVLIGSLVIMMAFIFIFKEMGEFRTQGIYGKARIDIIISNFWMNNPEDPISGEEQDGAIDYLMDFLARGSVLGQLSQVARIADDEGFYGGDTLQYIVYAFIPRVIWPEKPQITPGQWFAEKIGRGQRINENKFSNSINMTLPGEAYLNFGWAGALIALLIMTIFFAAIWETSKFQNYQHNPAGHFLGLAVFTIAVNATSTGAFLQLIFYYLMLLAVSRSLILLEKRRKGIHLIRATSVSHPSSG